MRNGIPRRLAALSLALLSLGGFSAHEANNLLGADWPGYGGIDENHYSPLTEINDGNVSHLGLAWYYDIDVAPSSLSAPVAVDGVLYFAAGYSVVHAIDGRTGKLLWKYDPEVWKLAGHKLRSTWGIRGIAYANGLIFSGTADGRLIALDARTGTLRWSVETVDKNDTRYITGAPWVFKDKVVIGHGGADFGPVRGYVTAYNQETGRQAWRFFTVPGNPAVDTDETTRLAAKTWTGEWWKHGGGGTVWNAMAYDPKFDRLYIGTGNGSPWNQKIRSPGGGDNLFLSAIVALDPDTGKYIWHYQTNPGETWDFNSTMDIELADLKVAGKLRSVIMHAPKNGFFYVIDRRNGKLLSAKPIVPVNWAKRIDIASGRPVETPDARYPNGNAALVYPSPFGAHNIEAMSFNPKTRLVYIPAQDQSQIYVDPPRPFTSWKHPDGQRLTTGLGKPQVEIKSRPVTSALIAWDPVAQRSVWRIPFPYSAGGGGTATTAGNLVMQGRATGRFVILTADTGRELWSFDAQTAVGAQPITYTVDGRQYISVIAGSRRGIPSGLPHEWDYRTQQWRVLTFALDGKASLPLADRAVTPIVEDEQFSIDPAKVAIGQSTYNQRCFICHGPGARSAGMTPELIRSSIPTDRESFTAVVKGGLLQERGMPQFEELTEDEIIGLQHYIRARARQVAANERNGIAQDKSLDVEFQ
jgi:quinohemoprotein ethanol dehydrogenase